MLTARKLLAFNNRQSNAGEFLHEFLYRYIIRYRFWYRPTRVTVVCVCVCLRACVRVCSYIATLLGRTCTEQRCGLLLQLQRALSAGHNSQLYKNGWTNRDAVWVVDSGGPKEPCIRWQPRSPRGRGNLERLFPIEMHLDCVSSKRYSTGLQPCPQGQRRKRCFKTDSPPRVTRTGAMWPFIKILWPLVLIIVNKHR